MGEEYSTLQFEFHTLNTSINTFLEFVYFQYYILLVLSRGVVDFSIAGRTRGTNPGPHYILYLGALRLLVLSVELNSCHPFDA